MTSEAAAIRHGPDAGLNFHNKEQKRKSRRCTLRYAMPPQRPPLTADTTHNQPGSNRDYVGAKGLVAVEDRQADAARERARQPRAERGAERRQATQPAQRRPRRCCESVHRGSVCRNRMCFEACVVVGIQASG
jgi:hypothetical protein